MGIFMFHGRLCDSFALRLRALQLAVMIAQ